MTLNRRLVAALACRNQGSRLYGKPVQNLDIASGTRIIDNIIRCLQNIEIIDEVVLAISFGTENEIFKQIASDHNLKFIVGDEDDVLSRLISAGECSQATDVFRITSESPFLYFEAAKYCWETYNSNELDALFLEPIIDGCGFEIISLEALKRSHREGSLKHRSEMCSLYIRENTDYYSLFLSDLHTCVSIKMEAKRHSEEKLDMVVMKGSNDFEKSQVDFSVYQLHYDHNKKNEKKKYHTFLVFYSGSVILSSCGPETEMVYNRFAQIIEENKATLREDPDEVLVIDSSDLLFVE